MRREGDKPEAPRMPPDAGRSREAQEALRQDQEHLRELQKQRRNRVVKVIIALAIAAILIIFIVSNSQSVPVDYVFFTRRPALIWVMFACAVLGGIVGYLIGRPGKQIRFHRAKEERR